MKKWKALLMTILSFVLVFSISIQDTAASSMMQSLYDETLVIHGAEKNGKKAVYGIDVSYHQGKIDWQKVKAAGIEFAFIRLGYSALADGTPHLDVRYQENIQNAKAAGVKVGVYYYSQATNVEEAQTEVNFIANNLQGIQLDLPVVYDAECGTINGQAGHLGAAKLSKDEWTNVAVAFCEGVRSLGYTPMFYGSISKVISSINYTVIDSKYQMWIARYKSIGSTSPNQLITTNYNYKGDYEVWQYSDHGHVNGISGYVDLDIMYVDANSSWTGSVYYNNQKIGAGSGLTATASGSSIKLQWSTSENATSYKVYRSETYSKNFKMVTDIASTTYTDSNVSANKEYYYYIVPVGNVLGALKEGTASSTVRAYCTGTSLGTLKTNTSVAMRKEANTSASQVIKLPKKATVTGYCETKGTDGNAWLKVKYTKGKKSYTGYVLAKRLDPVVSTVKTITKTSCTDSTVTIGWKKVSGATGYEIYKSNARNGSYKKIAAVTGENTLTYTVTGLEKSVIYYYKVRAYRTVAGRTGYSDYVVGSGGTTANASFTVKAKKADKLRQYAGTSYKSLVKVPKNAKLTVVYTTKDNKNRVWYKVQYTKGKKTYTGFFLKTSTK